MEGGKSVVGEDESMACEEENEKDGKAKSSKSKQNEKLYAAEGILNTKMVRAEKKRKKKASKLSSGNDAMDDDYNFKVDYVKGKQGCGMEDDNDDDEIKAEVPMQGLLDEEES